MKVRNLLVLLSWLVSAVWLGACAQQGDSVVSLDPNEVKAETTPAADVHVTGPQEGLAWFQPTAFLQEHWDLSQEAEKTWLYLTPKAAEGRVFKVLFISPSVSPAFDRSVSKVLSVFDARNLAVEGLVVLAAETEDKTVQPAAMQEALDYAEAHGFDLVYAVGSRSAAVLNKIYSAGRLPVVTVLAKDPVQLKQVPDYEQGSGTNIAYTSVSVPVDVQMIYLLQAMPKMKNIILVYEGNNIPTVETQVIPLKNYVAEQNLPIKIWDVAVQDAEQAKVELEKLTPGVLAQALADDPQAEATIFLIPASRSIQDEFDMLVQLAGKTPIFSLYPDVVREGLNSAVLAIGVSFDSNSLLAGNYGIRILQDLEKPGDLPVGVIQPPDIAVNFAKARELGLRIPFSFFESATLVFDPDGKAVK